MPKETALTVQSPKPLAISQSCKPPSQSWVMKQLALLATARQATVSRDTYLLYASEISDYPEDEISRAIRKFALRPREEGETAFPDLGTFVQAVKYEGRERRERQAQERESFEWTALAEEKREHPERFISFAEVMREVMESRNANAGK